MARRCGWTARAQAGSCGLRKVENFPARVGGGVAAPVGVCADAPRPTGAAPTLSARVSPGQRQGRAVRSTGAGAAMAPLRGWAARDRPGPVAFPAPRRAPPRSPRRWDPAAAPELRLASGARSDDHGQRPGRPARRVSGGGRLRARAMRDECCGGPPKRSPGTALRLQPLRSLQPAPRCLLGTLAQSQAFWVPTFSSSSWSVYPWGGPYYDHPSFTDEETEA